MQTRKSFLLSPGRIILGSMLLTIIIGAALLSCNWAHYGTLSLIDSLFTATSATCVTGLLTVPLTSFTTAGQCIILLLMQVGALGLISLTVFLLSLFINLGLSTSHMTGEILEVTNPRHTRSILFFIVIFTAVVELLGALATFFTIHHQYSFAQALFYSLFHAVSSFCNAGIVIFPHAPATTAVMTSPGLMCITSVLVLLGGLGFVVWHEIAHYCMLPSHHKHVHLSLHSKIVFLMTGSLIAFMSTLVFLLEYLHHFLQHPSFSFIIASIFDGICLRSAGFTTIEFSAIHLATLFSIMIISFIGSSPGSTGGGIKTTTTAVFLAAIKSTLSRRTWVEIKQRTIPNDQVFKAMAIFALASCWLAMTIFILLLTEQGWRFVDIVSEAFAAFTNLGLSTGITPYLSPKGKLVLASSMLIGRIGSLTLLLAFKRHQAKAGFHYPEERILMG